MNFKENIEANGGTNYLSGVNKNLKRGKKGVFEGFRGKREVSPKRA